MEEIRFKKLCKDIRDNAEAEFEYKEFVPVLDILRDIKPTECTPEQCRKLVEIMKEISTIVVDDEDGNFLYEETKIGNRKPIYNYEAG